MLPHGQDYRHFKVVVCPLTASPLWSLDDEVDDNELDDSGWYCYAHGNEHTTEHLKSKWQKNIFFLWSFWFNVNMHIFLGKYERKKERTILFRSLQGSSMYKHLSVWPIYFHFLSEIIARAKIRRRLMLFWAQIQPSVIKHMYTCEFKGHCDHFL